MKCPLCNKGLLQHFSTAITINGLCLKCAKETYDVYRELGLDEEELK